MYLYNSTHHRHFRLLHGDHAGPKSMSTDETFLNTPTLDPQNHTPDCYPQPVQCSPSVARQQGPLRQFYMGKWRNLMTAGQTSYEKAITYILSIEPYPILQRSPQFRHLIKPVLHYLSGQHLHDELKGWGWAGSDYRMRTTLFQYIPQPAQILFHCKIEHGHLPATRRCRLSVQSWHIRTW